LVADTIRYTKSHGDNGSKLTKLLYILGVLIIVYDLKREKWVRNLRLWNPLTYVWIIVASFIELGSNLYDVVKEFWLTVFGEIKDICKQESLNDNERYWKYRDAPKK
jgi:hypothetical protein